MKITVTQEDIDHGIPRLSSRCAISHAIRRQTGEWGDISLTIIKVRIGGVQYYGNAPKAARQFIRDLDAGRPVEPFSFDLAGVPEVPARDPVPA